MTGTSLCPKPPALPACVEAEHSSTVKSPMQVGLAYKKRGRAQAGGKKQKRDYVLSLSQDVWLCFSPGR